MKSTVSKHDGKLSVVKSTLLSLLVSVGTLLTGAVIVTACISSGSVDESSVRTVSLPVVAVSVFLGSVISLVWTDEKSWVRLAALNGLFYLILVGSNIILFDGNFAGIGPVTIMVLLGVLAAVAIKIIQGKGHSKRKYKRRYR